MKPSSVDMRNLARSLSGMRPSASGNLPTWLELHGVKDWVGLVDPLLPSLRDELLKYGTFAKATYDAYDSNPFSKSRGSSLYAPGSLLNKVGLGDSGYEVTRYLYAAMTELPKLPWPLTQLPIGWLWKLLQIDSRGEDSNWMGFVAVSGDEESRRLGVREILVAWRGTTEPSEWFKDAQWRLEPLKTSGTGSGTAMVEHGFQSIYTSNSNSSRFTMLSASELVKAEIKSLVDAYRKEDGKEDVTLTVIGHSLGGALALLSAYDAAAESISGLSHVNVISFAAPQVGDAAFVDELARKGVKVLRVVIKDDEVPKLPGLVDSLYQHTGVAVELDMDDQARRWHLTDVAATHRLKTYLHLLESTKGLSGGSKADDAAA